MQQVQTALLISLHQTTLDLLEGGLTGIPMHDVSTNGMAIDTLDRPTRHETNGGQGIHAYGPRKQQAICESYIVHLLVQVLPQELSMPPVFVSKSIA